MKRTLKLVILTSLALLNSVVFAVGFQKEAIKPIPAPQETSDKSNFGKSLFSNTLLSQMKETSCLSCHQEKYGYSSPDGKPLQIQSLLNISFMNKYFWDSRGNSLKEAIKMSLYDVTMMGNESSDDLISRLKKEQNIVNQFDKLYNEGLTEESLIDVLNEYLLTLTSPNAPFDKFLLGDVNAINAKQKKGYELFKSYGCISCHQGINIGGNIIQRFGIYDQPTKSPQSSDLGLYHVTGNEDDKFVFRVPSLRNVAITGPYFHNGSAKSLRDAIQIMGMVQLNQKIPLVHIKQIESFLETLTGEWEHD